ncbi:MAG TPA: hypothetical protein VKB80_30075 [Kofleriaceae bacterium]|nr:hypothetical protein [Kofleriaceae bacterium]
MPESRPLAPARGLRGARRSRARVAPACFLFAAGLLLPGRTGAADTLSGGSVSVESRVFDPDGAPDDAENIGLALTTKLEIKHRARAWRLGLRGFARLDALDETRNFFDLEEANVTYTLGPVSLVIGSQVLNWSTTEAFHPSDVMNSRNLDSDLANPEKLGEPMVEMQVRFLQGSLSAYYMPVRIAPNVLPASSRLSFLPPGVVELGDALWIDRDGTPSDGLFAHQGAVRLAQTVGSADIALHVVDHSDRTQPTFTPDLETGELRPTYHTVTQAGLNYVEVFGGLLFKLEAVMRTFRAPDPTASLLITPQRNHEAVAAGLEYSWTTAVGAQATVILEGQAVNQSEAIRAQLDPFQRDVLVGYRHFFNDVMGRDLLVFFITDVERPNEYVASAQYSQRLTDQWSVGALVRSLHLFGRDVNQVDLTLTRSY